MEPIDAAETRYGHDIQGWHGLVANSILIQAGVHASAALFHHYVWGDGVLARMLPWAARAVASQPTTAE